MSNVLFSKRLKENVRAISVNIACVFMIALLMCACAGGNTKQALSQANETGQVSAKAESENSEISDDQKIVCRYRAQTGRRYKNKVCNTKAQWAMLAKKNSKKTDEVLDRFNKASRSNTGSQSDSFGGSSSGMPR